MFPRKKTAIITAIVIILLLITGFLYFIGFNPAKKDISKISDKDIIEFLFKDKDSANYIEKNKDFKIEEKMILTKESIAKAREGEKFKEVYEGLALENNRYLKIDLINSAGSLGHTAVLDFKKNKVVKSFGMIFLKKQ